MSQSNGERLDSWKEIAVYLGRDLRTVRRWEKEKGLPVRRVPGGERRAVFAYRADIDSWLMGQVSDGLNGQKVPAQIPQILQDVPAAASEPVTSFPATSPNSPRALASKPRAVREIILPVGLLCALVLAAYISWGKLNQGPISQVSFNGNSLLARDGRGAILWSYDFSRPLVPNPETLGPTISIADLGPGRQRDVLVLAPFSSPDLGSSANDTLFCFSESGKVMWQHVFDDTFRFGENDYGSPWVSGPMMVARSAGDPSIWVAAQEMFWSASTLTRFDRDGEQKSQFVNWGHIAAINHVRNSNGSFILVGGISNQCDCAMFAVLREDNPSGSSPATDPAFTCKNCPEGKPYRYLLFPRSELTELSGAAYNSVRLIQVNGGKVWIATTETKLPGSLPGPDWIKYDLSDSFVPQAFTISDHFWTLHREMEAEGRIHHTVAQCPERTSPRKVKMWSAEHGWQEISVPVSTER